MSQANLDSLREAISRLGYLSAYVDEDDGRLAIGARTVTQAAFRAAQQHPDFHVERFRGSDGRRWIWITMKDSGAPAVPSWASARCW